MRLTVFIALVCYRICFAQITIPDGTKLRVRLEQPLSSATAERGQSVELTVAEAISIGGAVVIKEGARVTGTITQAVEKKRMGRAGKLDFSIDRVVAADGQWVPIRHSLLKNSGESHAVRTGVLTAGAFLLFPPAAPVMLLWKGKDTTLNRGITFEVFTDSPHAIALPGVSSSSASRDAVGSQPTAGTLSASAGSGTASVTITASTDGADIEVDGNFVGNTPTTLQLVSGSHEVIVRSGSQSWRRTVQVTNGSTISLNAVLMPIMSATSSRK